MKPHAFKVGDIVFHKQFGLGTIIDEWGFIPLTDDQGNQIFKNERRYKVDGTPYRVKEAQMIDCRAIYDVRFGEEAKCRSVNQCWLAVAISQPV